MKKLFILLLMLPICWGCDKEKTPQPLSEKEELQLKAEMEVDRVMDLYGEYDVAQVTELLCGKLWMDDSMLEYNEGWSEIISVIKLFRWHIWMGCKNDDYQFYPDGTYIYHVDAEYEPGAQIKTQEGQWSFDKESRRITLTHSNYSRVYLLQALGEDAFLWEEFEQKNRFFREIYKVYDFAD